MKFHLKSFLLGAISDTLAGRSFKKHSSYAKFPSLKLLIPSEDWPERGKYINLVFHFYTKNIGRNTPWKLIYYEQEKQPSADPSSLVYPKKGTVLKKYKHHVKKIRGKVDLSNNVINTGVLYDFIHCTMKKLDSNNKILIFTPCYTHHRKCPHHVIYKVHIKEYDPLTGAIKDSLEIDKDCFNLLHSGLLYNDDDGDHIKSNPCPPFTVQLDAAVQK